MYYHKYCKMLLKLDVKQAHLERIYRRMSYKKKSRFAKLSRYEDNFQCWFPRDIGFLHNNPFAPPVPRGIWQRRGIRGEEGGKRLLRPFVIVSVAAP